MYRRETSEKDLAAARKIYEKVSCMMPKGIQKNDDRMVIGLTVKTPKNLHYLFVDVDADMKLLRINSKLFDVDRERIAVTALAVNYVNSKLINGCFFLEISNRNLFFRINESFGGNTIGKDTVEYLIGITTLTLDNFKMAFFELSQGFIELDEFAEMINN